MLRISTSVLIAVLSCAGMPRGIAEAVELCRIDVVDKETRWPVPLVELRTVHGVRFVTDNAGRIAFDLLELMGRETWFDVIGHGYERPADGFGKRGVRLVPRPGETHTVEVERTSIAKRLGRLTGAGLFAESQKLGLEPDGPESGIVGCDSVQNAVHRGRMFWTWGDTSLARYPLGIFDSTGATTAVKPLESFEPPVRLKFDYFTDEKDAPRGVAKMPGSGATWVTGFASLPDAKGKHRLVATYMKVKPPMEAYEQGLCAWDDSAERFEHVKTLWTKSDEAPKPPLAPRGHSVIVDDEGGKPTVLFGDPLPTLRCAATFEAWQNPEQWEPLNPPERLASAEGAAVAPHGGSIAWNGFRKRWVAVFGEVFGKPSFLGEIWYAEADAPTGPWGPAVKVLSHDNYSFYNPRLHAEFTPEESPVLLFEGTYTREFADRPPATPRYDYNQLLYRLDLDDPRLAPAQGGDAED